MAHAVLIVQHADHLNLLEKHQAIFLGEEVIVVVDLAGHDSLWVIHIWPHSLLVFLVARSFTEQISGKLGLHYAALTTPSNDFIEENYVVVDFSDSWPVDSCRL